MADEREKFICKTCHRRLSRFVAKGRVQYVHGANVDHDAVPILEGSEQDTQFVCDFCSEPHPTWDFPTAEFAEMGPGGIQHNSLGNWAACDVCKVLIDHDDYMNLWRRSWETLNATNPVDPSDMAEFKEMIWKMQHAFKDHRSGDPIRTPSALWTEAIQAMETNGNQ